MKVTASWMMNDPVYMDRKGHGQVNRQGHGNGGDGVEHGRVNLNKYGVLQVLGQVGEQHAEQEQQVGHREQDEELVEEVVKVNISEEEETADDEKYTKDADKHLNPSRDFRQQNKIQGGTI